MYFPTPAQRFRVAVAVFESLRLVYTKWQMPSSQRKLSTLYSAGAGIQEHIRSYKQIERACGEMMSAVVLSWPLDYVSVNVQN